MCSENEKYDVKFSLLRGRVMSDFDYKGCSIKAKKLPNGEEKTSAFVADKGDKIQFTVTLAEYTNVEEWKLNGKSLDYGTASFTVIVDGKTEITALVDRAQFYHCVANNVYNICNGTNGRYACKTTSNGTLVIPSTIGSYAIKGISGIGQVRNTSYSAKHVHIADGIEKLIAVGGLLSDNNIKRYDFPLSQIRSIRLPNTLKTIDYGALKEMPHLVRYLVIPKSVTQIGGIAGYAVAVSKEAYDEANANNAHSSFSAKAVPLSIYFEHETDEEVEALQLDQKWCGGLSLVGKQPKIRIYVKNNSLLEKLNDLDSATYYNVIYKPFTSVPVEGDGRYEWSW